MKEAVHKGCLTMLGESTGAHAEEAQHGCHGIDGTDIPLSSSKAACANAVSTQGAPWTAHALARPRACSYSPALNKSFACSSKAIGWNSITCISRHDRGLRVYTLYFTAMPIDDATVMLRMTVHGCSPWGTKSDQASLVVGLDTSCPGRVPRYASATNYVYVWMSMHHNRATLLIL